MIIIKLIFICDKVLGINTKEALKSGMCDVITIRLKGRDATWQRKPAAKY